MSEKIGDGSSRNDFVEIFKLHRLQEEHENTLIGQRLTSFVALQSVLIATFGFSYQKYYEVKYYQLRDHFGLTKDTVNTLPSDAVTNLTKAIFHYEIAFTMILCIFCIVGFLSSRTAYESITAAIYSQSKIRKSVEEKMKKCDHLIFPPFAGGDDHFVIPKGRTFSTSLPYYFKIIWSGILALIIIEYFAPFI